MEDQMTKRDEERPWDEDEDVGTRGPDPERLNTELTPEELARRVMKAGKPGQPPKPDVLDEEDEEAGC